MQDIVIDGQGATIVRSPTAPEKGILAIFESQNVTIKNLTIEGGKATTDYGLGGGLWVYSSTVRLENVKLINNTANGGGGLQIEHPGSQVTIVNSVIANNTALEQGAAIYAKGGLTVLNSTIVDGSGNPSQGILAWKSAEIRNSIVSGFAIGILSAGEQTVVSEDHNAFSDNGSDMQELSAGQFVHGGGSQSYYDMRFVDPTTDDYRLRSTSPAIDKGGATSDVLDADGLPRPFAGGQVDAGAYEFQGAGGPALAIYRQNPLIAAANQPFVYRLTVKNEGVAAASELVVLDTLPDGVSSAPGSISNGGILEGNQIRWNLGALAPGQSKVLTYQAQAASTAQNSDYRIFSSSDPAVFAIGRPQATVIGADLLASIAYAPVPDGYGFANYSGSRADDLTVADMVTIFGADAVCKKQNPCVLTTTAATLRQAWLDSLKSGHSEGMAAASLRHFIEPTFAPASLQSGIIFANELSIESMRRWFALYAVAQNLTPANANELVANGINRPTAATPVEVLDALLANLNNSTTSERYWLQIAKSPAVRGGGWHSVVPYAVRQTSADEYLIYIYDPNAPNDSEQAIQITRSTNQWSYLSAIAPDGPLYDYAGDASSANLRLASWQWQSSFPKRCDTICVKQAGGGAAGNTLEFYLDGEGYFLVTRSDGLRAGFHLVYGSPILEIPGAATLPTVNGFGLNIPSGIRILHEPGMTYSVVVGSRDTAYGNNEVTAHFNILGPHYVMRVTDIKLTTPAVRVSAAGARNGAGIEQTDTPFDSLQIGLRPDSNYISIASTLRSQETPALSLAINNPQGADFSMALSGMDLAAGYAAALIFDTSASRVVVENNDTATNFYTITAERLNPTGVANEASVAANDAEAVGTILSLGPEWDGVAAPPSQPNTNLTLVHIRLMFIPMVSSGED